MKKFIATLTIFSIMTFLSSPTFVQAQAGETFGGRLSGVFYCTCSSSLLLFIQDYKTGGLLRLVYGTGSRLLVGNPYGLYQLGDYGASGQCLVYVGTSCSSIQNDGLIGGGSIGFGTS